MKIPSRDRNTKILLIMVNMIYVKREQNTINYGQQIVSRKKGRLLNIINYVHSYLLKDIDQEGIF